jgi:hypothetical protein
MSKKISAIDIWTNGQVEVGEFFEVVGFNDNYKDTAYNSWQIFTKKIMEDGTEEANISISQGLLTITGQDYTEWGSQPAMDVNDWIYNWAAQKLGLSIL